MDFSRLTYPTVMALPLDMLKGLQMSTKAKIGLAGIFCLATITIAFDILRAIEILTKNNHTGSTALWTNLESAVAVIVSCLPSFRALLSPRKDGNAKKTTSRYRQRSLAVIDSAKICLTSGKFAGSDDAGMLVEAKSLASSTRGAAVDADG